MRFPVIFCVLALIFVSYKGYAHEEHKHEEEYKEYEAGEAEKAEQKKIQIFSFSYLTSHLHNKIVHFPIACGTVSAIFEVLSFKFPSFVGPTNVVLGITALSSIAAFISGKAIEEGHEDQEQVLELHETAGFITMFLYSLAFALKLVPNMRKIGSLIVIIAFFVVGFTGYLGGILAHE